MFLFIVIFVTSTEEEPESSDDEELGESILETVEVELGTLHLREFEVHPSRHRKKRRKKIGGSRKLNEREGGRCDGLVVNECFLML